MSVSEIISLLAIIVSVSFNFYVVTYNNRNTEKAMDKRVDRLEVQMEPLWNMVEGSVVKSLLHASD